MTATPTVMLALSSEPPTFAREAFSDDLWREVAPFAEAHYREVAFDPDLVVAPDQKQYETLEETGWLRCYVARRGGVLVGYASCLVTEHQHHAGAKHAAVDAVYVDPASRGVAGYAFLRWIDEELAREGVSVVRHLVKVRRDWSPLLERMGYVQEETVWSRRLDV